MDDTLELRDQLARAWRQVLDAAVENGAPPQAVIETMASVAHETFATVFGAAAAASYLQLLAEQLRDLERSETDRLVRGEDGPEPASDPVEADTPIDPAWLTQDTLFS
ncbi:hypothetical protein [Methylobacterium symbioticum]|mgnify:CR=1 FL=1|uniref:Uncharacterized protein n=1 Tax=Methylobacterium symbioticum TaxID=2584084 RepID=A0A509EL95_9HYPH|nr:hypothetical protein [Methylobacterium symbioticum]VUD74928.1 hypothetical protein MET9862_05562 [Methylobacterium symbioticum]